MTISDTSVLDGESLRAPRISTTTPMVCLNFKVPLHIRQQFKAYAARRNMSSGTVRFRTLVKGYRVGLQTLPVIEQQLHGRWARVHARSADRLRS
jgi:hypothetical protein